MKEQIDVSTITGRKIEFKDWLLILGLVLSPMTGFRIWKVGPGEVLCLIWCMLNYRSLFRIRAGNRFLRFWSFFLLISFLGYCWGMMFYPAETDPFGMLTWVYFAVISLTTVSELCKRDVDYLMHMLGATCILSAFWYMFLYIYSMNVSSTFLEAKLWLGGIGARFTGGANNPNQLAVLISITTISCIVLFFRERKFKKILYLICAAICVFILTKTETSTAYMAVVVGAAIYLWKQFGDKFLRLPELKFIFILLLTGGAILFSSRLYELFMEWVSSDSNGLDRFEIYSTFPTAFFKNPLIGLGPGVHARDGYMEFHNTYLEVLAMSGVLGGVVFATFSWHLLKVLNSTPISLAILATLYVFGFAGFDMRSLPYWIFLSIAYAIASKGKEEREVYPKREFRTSA